MDKNREAILQARQRQIDHINKAFHSSSDAEEDDIEKARAVGEMHSNGKWVWTEYKPGKFDWRGIPAKKGSKGTPAKPQPKAEEGGLKGGKGKRGFIKVTKLPTASELSVGDRIEYVLKDKDGNIGQREQRVFGTVVDHFDDGVMIKIDNGKKLTYFNEAKHEKNRRNYNYNDYTSKDSTRSFEIFDGEESYWGGFGNIKSIKKQKQ